ncbi:MAG: cellulase N-terminal Ig-like domain-containing protein [Fimbriimonas sp.]
MLSIALAALFLINPNPQAARDVTPNGSFSLGTAQAESWTDLNLGSGKLVASRDTSAFASAPASLQLSTQGTADGSVSAALPDIAGNTLEISGKVRDSGPGVVDAQLAIFAQDADYKMIMWQPIASRWHFKTGVWSEFSGAVKMPSNAKHARAILLIKGEGSVWLDDLKIVATPVVVKPILPTGTKSNLVEVLPVSDQIIALHFNEGYVIHHKAGQKRGDEQVVIDPLDVGKAILPGTYSLTGTDPAYATAAKPTWVGRKSKGSDFAWFVDRWMGDHAENDRPDHVKEHWIYLSLPRPLKSGQTYTLGTSTLAKTGSVTNFTFDERKLRSDSVHVNLLGYVPSAPAKFGYLYQWLGDKGGADFSKWVGKKFWLVDTATNQNAFEGKVAFRKSKDTVETQQVSETPKGNFQQADVYECDFSSFSKPGSYVLAVEGVGRSFPFRVNADVYREAFRVTTRGLFHNRSGVELKKANTDWTRPAPHNPLITPGFAGKLKYTTSRFIDWKDRDNSAQDKPAIEAGIRGPIDVWGWYQDAGDWDSYASHMRVPYELLLTYQLAPRTSWPGS